MEESLTDTSNNITGPDGEAKRESAALCDSSIYSQDNLLYGNETESLVTEKLFSQTKKPNIEVGDADKHSDDDDGKSNTNPAPLLQPRCLKTGINSSQNEITATEEIMTCDADITDHQTLPQSKVENENKLVNELEAIFSGSESDHLETTSEKDEKVSEKNDNDLSEQNIKPKSLPALSLVAEYADSGNDTEEEIQQIRNPDVPLGINSKMHSFEDSTENVNQNASKTDDQTTNIGFNKTTSDSMSCSPVNETTQETANSSENFSVVLQETTCLQASFGSDLKDCKWSDDSEKELHAELEVDEKLEVESDSDSLDENGDELSFMDLDSEKAEKLKDSTSKEKRHKKKKKKKSKKASSNSNEQDGIEREKRKEKNKSSRKDRSRQDSSSYSEEKNKNYQSDDSTAEFRRRNHRDRKRSRSRSRTRSPRRKHRHRSRSRSRNRSRSSSRRRRHSRSRSRDRSSRRYRHSPSRRKRTRSRSRSRHRDRHSNSTSSHRKRERSHEKLSERRGSHRSSREKSSERKKSGSPQRRYSSDSNLSNKKEKQSPRQPSYKPLPTAVTSMSEEEKQISEETKLASETSSKEQTSGEKPNKKEANTSPKTENSDEELWAELEQLTYSSSSTAKKKSGYQVEKFDSRMRGKNKPTMAGGDVSIGSVKDDILPLVSTPPSPNQEEIRINKRENVKTVVSKSTGQSLWKPIKHAFDSSKTGAEQGSNPDDEAQVVAASNEPAISATDMSPDKRPRDSNNEIQSSEETYQKTDKITLSADQQQNVDTVQTQPDESQLGAESNAPTDSLQGEGVQKSPGEELLEIKTSPNHDVHSSAAEEQIELSEDGKPAEQENSARQASEENVESKSDFESPPKSQIKPFVSQFNQMQPTVIPGLDLMNPTFKSPPPPPPFNPGVMNTPMPGLLPPPPLPPWARFPPTPRQHQLPPPPFPPANLPPPSLLPVRMQQSPLWGRTHMPQNVSNLSTQNQNSVNRPFLLSQETEFKMIPPVMESETSVTSQRQLESTEKTEDTETEQEMPREKIKSLDDSILETDANHGFHREDSVSSPVDMEMSSPEGDIIDKLNEEFWESQQMNNQDDEEQNKVTFEDFNVSPTTPPPPVCAVSPPYSPRGEVVNLNVPEVLKLKQNRRSKKDKSTKKKPKLSAKSLSVIDRIHRQARVEEEAKHVLRIYYKHRDVNKEEYKTILRKIVPQVTNSNHSIDPERIRHLVKKYVAKVKGQRLLKQNER